MHVVSEEEGRGVRGRDAPEIRGHTYEYPLVDDQGKESLNFQISMLIYAVLLIPLVLIVIGIPLLVAWSVVELVLVVVASIRANNGERVRYPLTIRFIR